MATAIRRARPEDAPFLAWVALTAARSHVERGFVDVLVPGEGDGPRLAFMETLLTSERRHWCHHAGFLVAEVDGRPAAALCGYAVDDPELAPPVDAIVAAARARGWSDADLAAAFGRLKPIVDCLPEDVPGAWAVEWVATDPAHRRRGLVDALVQAALDEGRARGHRTAQILILIGNEPARRAYEKAGFRPADERRSPEVAAAIGAPGYLQLRRPLGASR